MLLQGTVRVKNFVQFKIVSSLEDFVGSNSFHVYNFRVISHPRKSEIKYTLKFSTHTVHQTPQRHIIFFQLLEKPTLDLAVQVMDKFQQMALQNQVTKAMSRANKLEFKQKYLAPIRTQETSVQCELLEK